MREYAVDFESFYSVECSITVQGVHGYLQNPECDIYMVSVYGDDVQWVGHPKDFDWSLIGGLGTRWLSHNAAFDGAVFDRLVELGVVDAAHQPEEWLCTADCAAYHGLPRNLKGAIASTSLADKYPVSKETRNAMKGKQWNDMTPEFKQEVSEYALRDSECCYHLWKLLGPHWPQDERDFSKATMLMAWQGIPVNLPKIESSILHLKDLIWEAAEQIPWYPAHPPLSKKQLDDHCRAEGLVPPSSLAKDSEECSLWEEQYGMKYPWVDAMRTYRRCNALMKKLEAMKIRTFNGRMMTGLKYFGGHTGRDSGEGGINVQNFSRSTMFGVNFRELIEAPEGKTFVLADLSNIEPRCLAYLSQDEATLNLCSTGMSPYEVHARVSMGWMGGVLKKENPQMYALAKARCLHGTVPILTNKGYKTIEELSSIKDKNKSCLRIWDGVEWVSYEEVIMSGHKQVKEFGGEFITEDHIMFTNSGEERVGDIYQRNDTAQLLGRNTPHSSWSDVRKLAYFVGRVLAKEWVSVCFSRMHYMWGALRERLGKHKIWEIQTMRKMRREAGSTDTGHTSVGEGPR